MTTLHETIKRLGGNLLDDTATHEFRFEIRSESSNRIYIVARRRTTQEWECSCPGWCLHAKKGGVRKPCKHLRAIEPELQLAAQQKIAVPAAPSRESVEESQRRLTRVGVRKISE